MNRCLFFAAGWRKLSLEIPPFVIHLGVSYRPQRSAANLHPDNEKYMGPLPSKHAPKLRFSPNTNNTAFLKGTFLLLFQTYVNAVAFLFALQKATKF
jgi:hypothetical protein